MLHALDCWALSKLKLLRSAYNGRCMLSWICGVTIQDYRW